MPQNKPLTMTIEIAMDRLAWSRGFAQQLIDGLTDDPLIARAGAWAIMPYG